MSKRFINPQLFFDAPEGKSGSAGVATPSGEMGKEDMIEFLGEEETPETIEIEEEGKKAKPEKKEEKKEVKGKEKEEKEEKEVKEGEEQEEEEEEDELKELEEELQEPDEEKLELVTPVRRREILKKYPQLFKDFPYLEKAYYREQAFTEILPTIDDAKEAVKAKETLDKFETDLSNGNTEIILKALKSESPKGFAKLVDNYLTTLSKVDGDAYHHVIGNVIKHTIMGMVTEARNTKNEALSNAAALLNQWVFGTSDFKPPSTLADKTDDKEEKEDKVSEREREFIKQRFETTRDDLNTRVNNSLKATIDTHIDPRQSMTDYVRRNAARDAMDSLEELISKDSRFKILVDKLWEKAFEDNFSKTSVDRIRSAYFSKAKALLPSVIKKARNEALRGMGKRIKDDSDESVEDTSKKGPVPAGRPRSSEKPSGKVTKPEDIPKGMRTLDFLMQD